MLIHRSVLFITMITIMLPACEKNPPTQEPEARAAKKLPEPTASQPPNASKPPTSTLPATQPEDTKPLEAPRYSWVTVARPLHYANVRRFQIRILVQEDHSRDEIEEILEQAAREAQKFLRANAIDVLAFAPGDDTTTVPTVGQGILAPYGRWQDAHRRAPLRYRTLMLNDAYFEPAKELAWRAGVSVHLSSPNDTPILLSRKSSNWAPEDEVASVAPGTEATIIYRKEHPSYGGPPFVRYKVEILVDGEPVQGWVHQEAVEGVHTDSSPSG